MFKIKALVSELQQHQVDRIEQGRSERSVRSSDRHSDRQSDHHSDRHSDVNSDRFSDRHSDRHSDHSAGRRGRESRGHALNTDGRNRSPRKSNRRTDDRNGHDAEQEGGYIDEPTAAERSKPKVSKMIVRPDRWSKYDYAEAGATVTKGAKGVWQWSPDKGTDSNEIEAGGVGSRHGSFSSAASQDSETRRLRAPDWPAAPEFGSADSSRVESGDGEEERESAGEGSEDGGEFKSDLQEQLGRYGEGIDEDYAISAPGGVGVGAGVRVGASAGPGAGVRGGDARGGFPAGDEETASQKASRIRREERVREVVEASRRQRLRLDQQELRSYSSNSGSGTAGAAGAAGAASSDDLAGSNSRSESPASFEPNDPFHDSFSHDGDGEEDEEEEQDEY